MTNLPSCPANGLSLTTNCIAIVSSEIFWNSIGTGLSGEQIVSPMEMLISEDFYYKQYGILFDTMIELYSKGLPVDLVTLQNKLKEKDNYEEIKSALIPNEYNMIVTPKEIDELIDNMSSIVARGINMSV